MRAYMVNDKVHVVELGAKDIVIPSHQYPLNGKLKVFTRDNTEPCKDEQIKVIFDSVKYEIGKCYGNTRRLLDALEANEITKSRYKSYVGWLFIGDTMPVHHAYTVIDDKHLLDFSPMHELYSMEISGELSTPEMKEALVDKFMDKIRQPNSIRSIFGKADPELLYVGSECTPDKGIKIYQKLMKAFPKHPCLRTTSTGMTEMQNLIMERLKDGI